MIKSGLHIHIHKYIDAHTTTYMHFQTHARTHIYTLHTYMQKDAIFCSCMGGKCSINELKLFLNLMLQFLFFALDGGSIDLRKMLKP